MPGVIGSKFLSKRDSGNRTIEINDHGSSPQSPRSPLTVTLKQKEQPSESYSNVLPSPIPKPLAVKDDIQLNVNINMDKPREEQTTQSEKRMVEYVSNNFAEDSAKNDKGRLVGGLPYESL
mmetsp:Transcript_8218/g.12596  ORF Transcript_8218/g.12596 Transcript_8218/m.12596 type:complete len:121 (-) Transcript_8218:47-409(-)